MENVRAGDTVFRMLDDLGFAATVRSVDAAARTASLRFEDGAEESDVDFDEIELADPAEARRAAEEAKVAAAAAAATEAADVAEAAEAAAQQPPGLPCAADFSNGNTPLLPRPAGGGADPGGADSSGTPALPGAGVGGEGGDAEPPPPKEKKLTMSQMMAQLSARVDAFAKDQAALKEAFDTAHEEREVLTEEVRRSKDEVARQEAHRNRAAREYQLADLQLKRASADIDMALKTAVPFLTGAVQDFRLAARGAHTGYSGAGMPMIAEGDSGYCDGGGGGGAAATAGGGGKADGPAQEARAAVVTTVRYARPEVVAAFCRWHLFKGFAHLYLFFEDPAEAFAFKQYLRAHLTAGAQTAEEHLNHSWMKMLSGETLSIVVTDVVDPARADMAYVMEKKGSVMMRSPAAETLDTEIMARQCLNAEIAAQRACTHPTHAGGPMDWLLHIDIDELFLVSSPDPHMQQQPTAGQHFAAVPSDVRFVAYVNHEAVPEHAGDVRNYFAEVSLFKRNPNVFRRQAQEAVLGDKSVSGQAREWWSDRARATLFPDPAEAPVGLPAMYFLAYANGKSAVRLDATSAVAVVPQPLTVHRWKHQDIVGTYWDPDQACVLHYAQCGAAAFQRKFQLLKVARTDWWKRLPLYKAAREACDDTARCREIYKGTVCLTDPDEVSRQESAGVCVRILEVQDVLGAIGF